MTYTFNFKPTTTVIDAHGQPQTVPHLFDVPASEYIAEQLLAKVNTENPALDYRIAIELRNTNSVELTPEEKVYFINFIVSLPVDNLYKGQLLEKLN